MKIVHVANYFMPEFGYQEHYLAKKHAELGHEVHVITSDRAYPAHEEYRIFSETYPDRVVPAGIYPGDGYSIHRLHGYVEKNLQILLKGLIRKIKDLDPDVVIMHGLTRYEALRLTAWKTIARPKFKLIVDDHGLFSNYHPNLYRKIYHGAVDGILTDRGVGSKA